MYNCYDVLYVSVRVRASLTVCKKLNAKIPDFETYWVKKKHTPPTVPFCPAIFDTLVHT
jgi:hypothetical protein